MPGIAVVGVAGGVGTTLLTAALALTARDDGIRVLGIDCHGGGPHALWGVEPERTVDNLLPVRPEVDAAHVHQVAHRHAGRMELVAGPGNPAAAAEWVPADAERLAAALAGDANWIADLGRGGHPVQGAMLARARDVVVVTCASPAAAAAARHLLDALPPGCQPVVALVRRRDESLSARSVRRLIGHEVVEIPWDRSGAEQCATAASPGRRGLWGAIGHLRHAVGADA